MESKSNPNTVLDGGRVFYHGLCYKVPSELTRKRVWLVADPNRVDVIWLKSDTGALLGEGVLASSREKGGVTT